MQQYYPEGRIEYDKLIRKAQATTDQKVRMDSMAAAEKLMLEDVAIMPTYERTLVYTHSDKIKGVIRRVTSPDPDFTYAKVVE